jgi:hypothetical protein
MKRRGGRHRGAAGVLAAVRARGQAERQQSVASLLLLTLRPCSLVRETCARLQKRTSSVVIRGTRI